MRFLLLIVYFASWQLAAAQDYYGVYVGKLRNASYALEGDVYLVNSTHLQIIDFTIKRVVDRTRLSFVFQNSKAQKRATGVFEYKISNAGDWLRSYEKELRDGVNNKRLIVQIPGTAADWEIFGIWSDAERYISSLQLTKEAPHQTCCIRDATRDVVFGHYGTRLNPIVIIDAQTLLLQRFTIEGTKPPDAWIYVGRGEINQENGKKALILGRDTPEHHCSIREDWTNEDIVVRLAEGQTVYDIEWVSVFCYNYSVDFAHLPVNLDRNVHLVPAYLPEFRTTAPFRERRRRCK